MNASYGRNILITPNFQSQPARWQGVMVLRLSANAQEVKNEVKCNVNYND